MSFLTRPGCSIAKARAMRQPIEWAISVAPDISACSKMPFTSAAKEGMLSTLSGDVGERPWPSRSKRWRECERVRESVFVKGFQHSDVPPIPCMKMMEGPSLAPRF